MVAEHLSRPVRPIQVISPSSYLGHSKEEISTLQMEEPRWREMKEYLQGGNISKSKFPRTTLEQFVIEDDIIYFYQVQTR